MYNCRIVADSVAENGARLTTFEVTYPLIIHAEVMTHRMFSRNVASNRAIPVKKLIASVEENPFVPEKFPKNQAGMQNSEWLEGTLAEAARMTWMRSRDSAVNHVKQLLEYDVHKQIANRLLAPFLWTTAVITATDWDNFWSLRCHKAAQPEIQKIAYMMRDAYEENEPKKITQGGWHLPYTSDKTIEDVKKVLETEIHAGHFNLFLEQGVGTDTDTEFLDYLIKVSIGRCARVSYLNHGENNPVEKDFELCERLINSRHMSPTEHVATPLDSNSYEGNFRGWKQYRKLLPGESGQSESVVSR